MGRPSLAAHQRRDVIRPVRLTATEKLILERRFGSVTRALRYLLDAYFRGDLRPDDPR